MMPNKMEHFERRVGKLFKISSLRMWNGCKLGVTSDCAYRLFKAAPSTLGRSGQPLVVGYRRAIQSNRRANKESRCNHLRFICRGEGVALNVWVYVVVLMQHTPC
jgi:hypothetical protein